MSDPAKYRSREEVQDVRERSDAIEAVKRDLAAVGVDEEALKAIDKEIRQIVAEASGFCRKFARTAPHELYTDVLVGSY